MAALCEKYPIPRHVRLVDSLLEEVSKDPASDSLKHGVLLFFLNAVKAKRPFLDDVDPMRKVLQKILRFSADNLSSSSHAIVSSSIDIVSQLLSDYPECDFLWAPSHAETWGISRPSLFGYFFF